MKERPILFSAPMVRAILAGTKTQTRRVVKPQPQPNGGAGLQPVAPYRNPHGQWAWVLAATGHGSGGDLFACPYGKPGDRLWVREAWRADSDFDDLPPRDIGEGAHVWYEADSSPSACRGLSRQGKLRPGMFMPRWASRITLEVTGLRVERLQDISEADAIAEGCAKNHNGYFWGGPHAVSGLKQMATAQQAYRDLWGSINGPGSWDANPWVWCVEFKQVEA